MKLERGIVPKEQFDRVVPAHLEYVRALGARGHRVTDGYWGEMGGGMMVFDAASMDEARALVEGDPLVREKCVEYELKEWRLVAEPEPGAADPGFCHAALRVRDLARSERFYVEGFSMRVEWRPDPENVYLTSGADNLALHAAADLADPRSPRATLDHIGFVVRRRDDVDRLAARMRELGIEFAHPVKDHRDGARSCYVFDPDGNTVQIIHHPPISGAGLR